MKTRTSHKLVIGLMAAMTLSAGCTADQLQSVRETIAVADTRVETTRKSIDTVEKETKMAACMKENTNDCFKQSTARKGSEYGSIMDILHETL